jgi:hypothetical protein
MRADHALAKKPTVSHHNVVEVFRIGAQAQVTE